MGRKAYPSDISDSEWAIIAPLLPQTKTHGLMESIMALV